MYGRTDDRNIIVSLTQLGVDTVLTDADARHHWLRDQLDNLPRNQLDTLRAAAHAIEASLADDDDTM